MSLFTRLACAAALTLSTAIPVGHVKLIGPYDCGKRY